MKIKIIKIGTSQGIVLNKKILKSLNLNLGDSLSVSQKENTISLKKEDDLDKEIDEYFSKKSKQSSA